MQSLLFLLFQTYRVYSGFDGAFTLPGTYEFPDDYTNITFANGTTLPVQNYAFVTAETWSTDVVDGKSFTEFFCIALRNQRFQDVEKVAT